MKVRRPGTKTILSAYKKTGLRPVRKAWRTAKTACGLGACLAARGKLEESQWATQLWGQGWVDGFCHGWDIQGRSCTSYTTAEFRRGFKVGAAAAKAVFSLGH